MRYLPRFFIYSALIGASFGICQTSWCQDKKAEAVSPIASISSESELIAILANADSPGADKAMACKRLAIYGSGAAASELGKLLSDEKFNSWSRIALEAIPGKEAAAALRSSAETLSGRLLVGVINSLGVRRDAESVEILVKRLKDADADVASAAAVALGNIGGKAASDALRQSLAGAPVKVRSAIAEGSVLCAERFLSEGNAAVAIEIYDEVRKADVPKQRVVEATRGAILARKQDGIPLVLEQLRSSDKPMFQIGLWMARELPGKEIVDALVGELSKATPSRASLIVLALADRNETIDLPKIVQVASSGPKEVRVAALTAISRIGDSSCVDPLLKFALEKDADLLLPVKAALAAIPDEGVDKAIIDRLPKASGEMQQLLIEVVGQRRIDATSELVKALESSSQSIRKAALESLGSTIPQSQLAVLIKQATAPKNADDAALAKQALVTAAIRMRDKEACAADIAAALKGSNIASKTILLETLGSVGGTTALNTIATAAKDSDPQMKDVASRLLGDWQTIDAAPVLLDLATTGPLDKFQVRAMRGYIRISRQFAMSEKDRIEMAGKALEAAKQTAEKKLVVENLTIFPSIGTLKLAIQATKIPEVAEDAKKSARTIAGKLGDKKGVAELMSEAGLDKP
jgi:HEAT repeat protein